MHFANPISSFPSVFFLEEKKREKREKREKGRGEREEREDALPALEPLAERRRKGA